MASPPLSLPPPTFSSSPHPSPTAPSLFPFSSHPPLFSFQPFIFLYLLLLLFAFFLFFVPLKVTALLQVFVEEEVFLGIFKLTSQEWGQTILWYFCCRYIPVLMSQAKIYWDLDNYAQVEKVNDKSALFGNCSWSLVFVFSKKKLRKPQVFTLPIRPFTCISSVTTDIISKLINNRTITQASFFVNSNILVFFCRYLESLSSFAMNMKFGS